MPGVNGQHTAKEWASKRIFTTGEAAEVCKVSQQTIIRCFDAGRLGGFRVPGSKFRRIPRAELIKFMRANEIPVGALDHGARRILVVDDDAQIIEMFKDLFNKNDRYDVKFCSTGYDAGLLTEQFRPNLIILDFMLPDVNGSVVCERIRSHEELKDTRIIFVSGVVKPEDIDSLRAAGADDFVSKPFDVGNLLRRIDELTQAA